MPGDTHTHTNLAAMLRYTLSVGIADRWIATYCMFKELGANKDQSSKRLYREPIHVLSCI